jgi:hypothetical protein
MANPQQQGRREDGEVVKRLIEHYFNEGHVHYHLVS